MTNYNTDILLYLNKELRSLKHITIDEDAVNNSYGITYIIYLTGDDDIFLQIEIIETDDFNDEYEQILRCTFELHSDYFVEFDDSDFDRFFDRFKMIISEYLNENIYEDRKETNDIITDKDYIWYLNTFPVFNIEYYNEFVDNTISEKNYLYKCLDDYHKKLLYKDIKNKYNYLEQANKFDLL